MKRNFPVLEPRLLAEAAHEVSVIRSSIPPNVELPLWYAPEAVTSTVDAETLARYTGNGRTQGSTSPFRSDSQSPNSKPSSLLSVAQHEAAKLRGASPSLPLA